MTASKFQCLKFFWPPLTSDFMSLMCNSVLSVLSAWNAHFHFLDTNFLILNGFWSALCWYFLRFSWWEHSKKMSLLPARTCVHHPIPVSRTSCMRPTDFLCSACEFRASMNDNPTWLQAVSSNICKKNASSHYSFCTFDVQVFFCRCSGMRTTDLLCLWISGGCQRTIWRDYSV